MGENRGGQIITNEWLAYINDDGDLIDLPHPIEGLMLQEQGTEWGSASLSGRIVRLRGFICLDCGELNQTASLHCFSGLG